MHVILQVFVIFAAAKGAGELFVRLRLPAIVGELAVGMLLGPHLLAVVEVNQATSALAQLGIVVLLFTAGLETSVSDLVASGRSAVISSAAGIVLTGAISYAAISALGQSGRAALLMAAALSASSVGIAARALSDLRALESRPARVVLAASVIDDVVLLAMLPLVQGLGEGSGWSVLLGVGGAAAFVVLVSVLGPRLARRHGQLLERPRMSRSPFVLSLALCLGLAALAEEVGLAALVGAFLAGMALAETRDQYDLARRMEPLFDFLVPFFVVVSAARMNPGSLLTGAESALVLAVVPLTILGKGLGCGLGALGLSARERVVVGIGMVPRGEVTLALGTAGLSSQLLTPGLYSVLLATVLVSTLVAPPLLRLAIPPEERRMRPSHRDVPPEASGREEGPWMEYGS